MLTAATTEPQTTQPDLLVPAIVFAIGIVVSIAGNWLVSKRTLEAAKTQADATVDAVKEQTKADDSQREKDRDFEREKLRLERTQAVEDVWRDRRYEAHSALLAAFNEAQDIAYEVGALEAGDKPGLAKALNKMRPVWNERTSDAAAQVRVVAGTEAGKLARKARTELRSWITGAVDRIGLTRDEREAAWEPVRKSFSAYVEAVRVELGTADITPATQSGPADQAPSPGAGPGGD